MNEKAEEYFYPYKITILCTGGAMHDLIPLLEKCRVAGSVGHTMRIVTDPDRREATAQFLFDGDGSSGINEIKVACLHWKNSLHLQTQNGEVHYYEGAWITDEERNRRMKERRRLNPCRADTCEADTPDRKPTVSGIGSEGVKI